MLKNLYIVLFLCCFMYTNPSTAVPILAFGDIRGHFEPCGCDPRTDVGGVRRIAASISRYREQNPQILVLHTGNMVGIKQDAASKQMVLQKFLHAISPDMSLVNNLEWRRLNGGEVLSDLHWVLSNSKKPILNINRNISTKGATIWGYLSPVDKDLLKADAKLLNQWKRDFEKIKVGEKILMFSGSSSDLKFFKSADFFNFIISSSEKPLDSELADQEQRDESILVRSFGTLGNVWAVPFGGGGVLRVGGLEANEPPKTLSESLKSINSNKLELIRSSTSTLGSGISLIQMIHWLRPVEEFGLGSEFQSIIDEYKNESKQDFLKNSALRAKDLPLSLYAGADACKSCHNSAFQIWQNSKHSRAFKTLVDQKKHEDMGCVQCHVVGYRNQGGYVNEELTLQLSNVQCENCHGPRKKHIENPTAKMIKSSINDCTECHSPSHSPGFDSKAYWNKIQHH